MKKVEIDSLVSWCAEHSRPLDGWEARALLTARNIIVKDPNNATAQQIVSEFGEYLKSGDADHMGFAWFSVGYEPTDEELAEREVWCAAHPEDAPRNA